MEGKRLTIVYSRQLNLPLGQRVLLRTCKLKQTVFRIGSFHFLTFDSLLHHLEALARAQLGLKQTWTMARKGLLFTASLAETHTH